MNNRLWNKNFSILWQGQFISDFGNVAFSVALGFWVLAVTATPSMPGGDLTMMGLVEACFAFSGVLLGPLAGAVADRVSRKSIIIAADFIRGICFLAMGALLLFNAFPFWVIFPLAVVTSASGAFFSPAISSMIPDIIPADKLTKANSARSFSTSLTQLVGNSLGGILYSILKAPLLILINGISFLYASITQVFMKVPFRRDQTQKKHIITDMADGIKYAFGNMGIRTILISGMLLNFFAVVGLSLMTPLFNSTPGFGVEKYGLVMGAFTAGALAGMVLLSALKVKPKERAKVFGAAIMTMALAMVPIGLLDSVAWMYPLAALAGMANAIVNVMFQTIMQTKVPSENRGKVFGIMSTVMGGLQPVAMAISGVAASFAGIRPAMVAAMSAMVLAVLPVVISRQFKRFINTDAAEERTAENGNAAAAAAEAQPD
jgi:DHA3 family macrolide efflux protein-like MFS transporter